MKLTISHKLIFAFIGLTLLVLIATLALARWSFEKGFLDYINALEQSRLELIRDELADEYLIADESWETLTQQRFELLLRQSFRPLLGGDHKRPNSDRPPHPRPGGRKFGTPIPPTALFDTANMKIVGAQFYNADNEQIRVPVIVNGMLVGELRSEPRRLFNSPQETAFSKQQLKTSWIIGIVSLILAAIVSTLLARGLLAPIRRMVSNVGALSSGNYETRLNETRTDELGELMSNLDHLAMTLEESQSSRRRWLAEISHELRTPLTVLNGEIEALKDGLRKFDSEQLSSLDQEAKRLKYLIDDLYELSLSDIGGLRYVFSPLNLSDSLSSVTNEIRKRASDQNIELIIDSANVWINADTHRLDQLFQNLFENALAYTDSPGRIEVRLSQANEMAIVEINDTPPGVNEMDCERLFDPLFRQEISRSRRTGGAGLGLAICQNIVKAHGGEIMASPSDLGGLCIRIQFPVMKETSS